MTERKLLYKVFSYGMSDVGLVRVHNEDTWDEVPELRFFVLADGMGGHKAGGVASKQAVTTLCKQVKNSFKTQIVSLRGAYNKIREAIENTNHYVHKMGSQNFNLHGMGTTLCCLYFHPNGLVYANVGDSRIYRLRQQKLQQITVDHSLSADLERFEQSRYCSFKNVITRAIGTEPEVEPSIHETDLQQNDIYLMCSDGLSDLLLKEDIEGVINGSETLQQAATELVSFAKRRGGHDNITVVLIQVKMSDETPHLS